MNTIVQSPLRGSWASHRDRATAHLSKLESGQRDSSKKGSFNLKKKKQKTKKREVQPSLQENWEAGLLSS